MRMPLACRRGTLMFRNVRDGSALPASIRSAICAAPVAAGLKS